MKEGYDAISHHFSLTREKPWKEWDLFLPFLKKEMSVLDVGCGNGRLIDFLKPYMKKYVGIDISSGMLREARKKYPQYIFKEGEMSEIGEMFPQGEFDTIFSIAAFHHLPTKKLREKTLGSFHTLLRTNGTLVLSVWNLFQKRYFFRYIESYLFFHPRWVRVPWKDKEGEVKAQRYYYSFTKRELKKLFEKSHFNILFLEYVKDGKIRKQRWGSHNLLVVGRKK